MFWQAFWATLTAVFFAELADKTQLVGITMSSKTAKPLAVWLGSVIAYAIVTVISVYMGAALGRFIKPEFIKYAGASLFIIIGALMFLGKI